MSGTEIMYCIKETFSMLFTLQGIIAWLSLSVLCGVLVLVIKEKQSLMKLLKLKTLILLLILNFAVCQGMLLLILAYIGNCKELFYTGFFIMIAPILMKEIIRLIRKRLTRALRKDTGEKYHKINFKGEKKL